MKHITKSVFILIILFSLSKNIFAVEGYKDFTWDMSKDQVINTSFCDFKAETESQKDISTLYCNDFPFGGKKRWGVFLFIDNKLLRIATDIEKNEIKLLIEIFDENYEKNPNNPPLKIHVPVPTGTFSWDNNTILLKVIPVKKEKVQQMQQQMQLPEESEQNVIASLIYTSTEYGKKLNEKDKLILKESIK